jgi:hypothetical protein
MIILNKKNKNTLYLSYEITKACNLRCSYCYFKKELRNKLEFDADMGEVVISKIKKFTEDYPDHKVDLGLLGGDPLFTEYTMEFIDKVMPLGISVLINTNLVPKDKNMIIKLADMMNKWDLLMVSASWHTEADEVEFKENIKYLYENIDGMICNAGIWEGFGRVHTSIVMDGNIKIEERVDWLNGEDMNYSCTALLDTEGSHIEKKRETESWEPWELKVFQGSIDNEIGMDVDGDKISVVEYNSMGYYNATFNYNTICHPLDWTIEWDGNIVSECDREPSIEYGIMENDIVPKRIVCRDTYCHCSAASYKELISERHKKINLVNV